MRPYKHMHVHIYVCMLSIAASLAEHLFHPLCTYLPCLHGDFPYRLKHSEKSAGSGGSAECLDCSSNNAIC